MSTAHASGTVSHGTYFAFWLDNQGMTVAIDSRQTDDTSAGTTYRDDVCKLHPLGDDAFFFAEGISANSDPRAPAFNIFEFASFTFQRQQGTKSMLAVADQWGSNLVPLFAELYKIYPDLLDMRHGGEIVNGHFAGIEDGVVKAITATILLKDGTFTSHTKAVATNNFTLGGYGQEVGEFFVGATERAKNARAIMVADIAKLKSFNAQDLKAVELRAIVENVPLWAGDPGSGGPVAILTIETATKKLRWIRRPVHCGK